jgi:putative transposase
MPRMARVVIPGVAHHVTQRGNRRADVFTCDADRQRYLGLLAAYADKHGLAIQAYCLMTNHVHLVVVPAEAVSLSRTLKPVHMRYAQHVNWTQDLTGRLWEGRFFSCPMDEAHLWVAVRYVERNPVRARLVRKAECYPWSSAAGHCGRRTDVLLSDPCGLTGRIGDWSAWLREPEDEAMVETVCRSTRTGRPAGSASFIDHLEQLAGRILRPKKAGRPRKSRK